MLHGYIQYNWSHCSECGVKDPSWMELNHFLRFLDFQLGACENSLFCDEKIVGEAMSGLKTFVIKFMIRMSKVDMHYTYCIMYYTVHLFTCMCRILPRHL